jgi:hypothetical protein
MGQPIPPTIAKLLTMVIAFSQLALRGPATASAQPTPDPNDLLRASTRASELPQKIAFHQEELEQFTRRVTKDGITGQNLSDDVARDGDRLDETRSNSTIGGTIAYGPMTSRDIWTHHQDLHRQQGMGDRPSPVTVVLSSPPRFDPQNVWTYGLFIDGIIRFDDGPIAGVLLDSQNAKLEGEEIINGDRCWVIDGATPSGNYKLWLDQSAGLRIRQAEVIKTKGDKIGADGQLPFKGPRVTLTDIQLSVHDITFQKFGDALIPVSGQMDEARTYDDGQVDDTHSVGTRSNIKINPDFAAIHAFIMDAIPDETPVMISDGKKINSSHNVWRDGKVVDKNTSVPMAQDDDPANDDNSPSTQPAH